MEINAHSRRFYVTNVKYIVVITYTIKNFKVLEAINQISHKQQCSAVH